MQTIGMVRGSVLLVAMLSTLRAVSNSELIVPGKNGGRRNGHLRRPWNRLRMAAKLPSENTIHDLRRSFGLRVAKRHGLHIASKLLRHTDVRVTERVYAPLDIEDLREAAESAAR